MAYEFLVQEGYLILETNFKVKGSEIDIIAKESEWYVFIEVKSYLSDSPFSVYTSLSKRKKQALMLGINLWLLENNLLDSIWRLDFVIYFTDKKIFEIYKHINLY